MRVGYYLGCALTKATGHVRLYREREHVSHEVEDVISLIIFMRYGSPMFKEIWKRANEFGRSSEWTYKVAPAPRGFSNLLIFLERFAPHFAPADVVAWLTRFASGPVDSTRRISRATTDNALARAERYVAEHRVAIVAAPTLELLGAGVALAGVLAARLRGA